MDKTKSKVQSKEIIKAVEENRPLSLPPEVEAKLRANMPKWIPEKEDIANSMYQVAQEYQLVVEDCLKKYHGFSENELKKLEKEIANVLVPLGEIERKGLSILSPSDMAVVGEIAEIRRKRLQFGRSGLTLPPVNKSDVIAQLANKKVN